MMLREGGRFKQVSCKYILPLSGVVCPNYLLANNTVVSPPMLLYPYSANGNLKLFLKHMRENHQVNKVSIVYSLRYNNKIIAILKLSPFPPLIIIFVFTCMFEQSNSVFLVILIVRAEPIRKRLLINFINIIRHRYLLSIMITYRLGGRGWLPKITLL